MAKKKVITLTEAQLNEVVYNTARRILNEDALGSIGNALKLIGRQAIASSGKSGKIRDFEKKHPLLTKIGKRIGMVPEEDKMDSMVEELKGNIIEYITRNHSDNLLQTFIKFSNLMTQMIGANGIQDSEEFASFEDTTNSKVPAAFYNNCVSAVNSGYSYLKKWMTKIPSDINELQQVPSNSFSVTPQDVAVVANNCKQEWFIALNYGFKVFAETCNECYKDIQRVFGNNTNIDRSKLVALISEFINDLKNVRNLMYRIDAYWFNGQNSGSNASTGASNGASTGSSTGSYTGGYATTTT